jgi:flagellar motor switch protein FliN/FliY
MTRREGQLSADLIETLRRMVGEQPPLDPPEGEVRNYPWNNPLRYDSHQARRLTAAVAPMAARATKALEPRLCRELSLLCPAPQMLFAEQVNTTITPDAWVWSNLVCEGQPAGLAAVTRAAAADWVDTQLAAGPRGNGPERIFTSAEQAVLMDTIDALLGQVSAGLVEQGGPKLVSTGSLASEGRSIVDGETYVQVALAAEHKPDAPIAVMLVRAPLMDPLAGRRAGAAEQSAAVAQQLMQQHLTSMDVRLEVNVGIAEVSMGDAMSLAPGDVLLLGRSAGEPIDVTHEGRLIARGQPVQAQGRYALQITHPPGTARESEDDESAGQVPASSQQPLPALAGVKR